MARREPDPPHVSDPLKGGLKHNPFAALKGASNEPSPLPAGSPPAPQPPTRMTPDDSRSASTHARVTVRRERAGRGGKTVTIAEGPGLAGRDLESLARELASGLGVGARVEEAFVVVQGDQRERLAAWLTAHGFTSVARGN